MTTRTLGVGTIGAAARERHAKVARLRRRLLVPTLASVVMIVSMVSSLGAPMVPTIAREYGVSLSTAQWSLTAAMLAGAVATPLMGRLSDIGFARPIILVGSALVGAGCALVVLPTGIAGVLVGRAMQGSGLALVPVAMGIARRHVEPAKRASTLTLLAATIVGGAGLGYPVTSLVANTWGLAAAFGMGAALALMCLMLAVFVLPRTAADAEEHGDRSVDWLGAALLATSTVCLLMFVSRGQTWGWASHETVLALALAVLLGSGWLRRSLRTPRPLIDLRLAARPATAVAHLTSVIAGVGVYMMMTLIPLIVQAPRSPGAGLGEPVSMAGLALVPYALFSVLSSRVTVKLDGLVRREALLPVGCVAYLGTMLSLTLMRDEMWQILMAMAIAGLGSGLVFSSLPAVVAYAVPMSETGSALGLNLVLRYVGHASGGAVTVLILQVTGEDSRGFQEVIIVASVVWALTMVMTAVDAWRRPPRPSADALMDTVPSVPAT